MVLTNIPTEIKRVFLSYAQAYFSLSSSMLLWNVDPRRSKIFIGDKYAVDPSIIERMPSIILSRGSLSWANTSTNQLQAQDSPISSDSNKLRTDLVKGSVTLQCTSKNGIEAEAIANALFTSIVGFKDQFRANGIHQILGISMGEEIPVRGDVEPRLFAVPINIIFTVQSSVVTFNDLYDLKVLADLTLVPNLPTMPDGGTADWWTSYIVSGQNLIFRHPPATGVSLKATFKGKYTLNTFSDIIPSGVIDGVNYTFSLPEEPYCLYDTLYSVEVEGSIY